MNPRPAAYEAAALPTELPRHKPFNFEDNKKFMIITESKPFGVIKGKLDELKPNKIAVISCNSCAKLCGTGGDAGLIKMVSKLKEAGFNVSYSVVVPIMCNMSIEGQTLNKERVNDADVIIVLGCAAGELILKKMFPNKKIISALDTIGLGAIGENHDLFLVKKF